MAKRAQSKCYELHDRGTLTEYRNLEETSETVPASTPLTAAEFEKIASYRTRAARKLKVARVLADAGLSNEAHEALLEGVPALGRAFAIEQRLVEPATLNDCLAEPLASCWKEALPLLRNFAEGALETCIPLLNALAPLTNGQTTLGFNSELTA